MKNAITPHPWEICRIERPRETTRTETRFEIVGYDRDFIIAHVHTPPGATELSGEYLANALQLRAAPEAIDALKEFDRLATQEGWNTPLFTEPFRTALQQARRVIAAATPPLTAQGERIQL